MIPFIIRVSALVDFESETYAERSSKTSKGLQSSWLQLKPLYSTEQVWMQREDSVRLLGQFLASLVASS